MKGNIKTFLDSELPYEEWPFFAVGRAYFFQIDNKNLKALAREKDHIEGGLEFNAIQMLNDAGQLTRDEIEQLERTRIRRLWSFYSASLNEAEVLRIPDYNVYS